MASPPSWCFSNLLGCVPHHAASLRLNSCGGLSPDYCKSNIVVWLAAKNLALTLWNTVLGDFKRYKLLEEVVRSRQKQLERAAATPLRGPVRRSDSFVDTRTWLGNEFQGISYAKSEHSSWYLVMLPACRTRFQLTRVSLRSMNGALLHQLRRNPSVRSPQPPYAHQFQGFFLDARVRL